METKKPKDAFYPIMTFKNATEFESWLEKNGETEPGVWLKHAKKDSGEITINRSEALDLALCFGWIDGQSKTVDEKFYLQKFTPRGKKSLWSKINRENVARLIKTKKMRAPGLTEIKRAKADGRWDAAYDSPKNMEIPEDFLKVLKEDKDSYEFFLTLNKTNLYAIAWRLQTAVKEETRLNRMNVILEMLKKKKKFQ